MPKKEFQEVADALSSLIGYLREPQFLHAISQKGTVIEDVFKRMNNFTVQVGYHSCLHELDMRIASISPATSSADQSEEFGIALDIALENITQCQHNLYRLSKRNPNHGGVDIVGAITGRIEEDINSYQTHLQLAQVERAYDELQEMGSRLRSAQRVFGDVIVSSAKTIPFDAIVGLFDVLPRNKRPKGLRGNLMQMSSWIVRSAIEKGKWHEVEEALFRVQPWIESIQGGGNVNQLFLEEWRAIETKIQDATDMRVDNLWVTKLLAAVDKVEALVTAQSTPGMISNSDSLGQQFQSCRRSVRRISQALDEESLQFCDNLSEIGERILDLRGALVQIAQDRPLE